MTVALGIIGWVILPLIGYFLGLSRGRRQGMAIVMRTNGDTAHYVPRSGKDPF